ncbi:phosphotransferase [Burkholderia arboris]|uniref:phosphotransferase n=1 Tax=Burkholderia arboris TaxID=488730 RepID=UPI001589ADAF|nr:phosphotransferase [Burkholderia arboris]
MSQGTDAGYVFDKTLTEAMPAVHDEVACDIVRAVYSIEPRALKRLTGERDLNYLVEDGDARRYVLKITHPSELAQVTELVTKALRHIEATDSTIPVPTVLSTNTGADAGWFCLHDGRMAPVRLFSFLQGTPLHQIEVDRFCRRSIGRTHARIGRALADFAYPVPDRDLLWDLKRMDRVKGLLEYIDGPDRQRLAIESFERFQAGIEPLSGALREQYIHNDLNPYNVLVDPATHGVSGVIDFGDIVKAPLINDLATAASYFIADADDPLAPVVELVAAYHGEMPLDTVELHALFPLILARLVMTVAITEWRASLHPSNSAYILRNNANAWIGLKRLARISDAQANTRFQIIRDLRG